jgi:hypothetical protein
MRAGMRLRDTSEIPDVRRSAATDGAFSDLMDYNKTETLCRAAPNARRGWKAMFKSWHAAYLENEKTSQ